MKRTYLQSNFYCNLELVVTRINFSMEGEVGRTDRSITPIYE